MFGRVLPVLLLASLSSVRRRRRLARTADSASAQIEPPFPKSGSSWLRHRRRPTPGAEALADLFAGEVRPAGIPTPFSSLFAERNRVPKLPQAIWLFDA